MNIKGYEKLNVNNSIQDKGHKNEIYNTISYFLKNDINIINPEESIQAMNLAVKLLESIKIGKPVKIL